MENKKTYEQAVEELSLMLLYLTRMHDREEMSRYRELSWKNYDFDILNKLENSDFLWQPKNSRGYLKYLYLTEAGRQRAQALLEEYSLPDGGLNGLFEFRTIRQDEVKQAAAIEKICFPPEEACTEAIMEKRAAIASDLFLVAIDRKTGKIAGFLNGLATDEYSFRDEFFTNPALHNPDGRNIMLLGLDVLPEYRRQGLAKELMFQYLRRESDRNRRIILLTCLKQKVKMYEKMGFRNCGTADSTWGGEQWYEMSCVLS